MNKADIIKRVSGLNEYMLSDSDKQILILNISSDYTYNKAIAIVGREHKNQDWYSVDDKNCFKTWAEIDAFIDGICKGKNTNFKEYQQER